MVDGQVFSLQQGTTGKNYLMGDLVILGEVAGSPCFYCL